MVILAALLLFGVALSTTNSKNLQSVRTIKSKEEGGPMKAYETERYIMNLIRQTKGTRTGLNCCACLSSLA